MRVCVCVFVCVRVCVRVCVFHAMRMRSWTVLCAITRGCLCYCTWAACVSVDDCGAGDAADKTLGFH